MKHLEADRVGFVTNHTSSLMSSHQCPCTEGSQVNDGPVLFNVCHSFILLLKFILAIGIGYFTITKLLAYICTDTIP